MKFKGKLASISSMCVSRSLSRHPWLWVKALLTALSIIFLLALLIRECDKLQALVSWRIYLNACIYGFAIYPFSLVLQALTWGMIIAKFGQVKNGWRDIEIYAYTYLMRHLPGAMWYLAGRAVTYYEQGVGTSVVLYASGLEWILLVATAWLVYIVYRGICYNLWSLLAFLAIFSLCLIPVRSVVRKIKKWEHLTTARHWLGNLSWVLSGVAYKELIFWGGLYAICYIIGGIILFLLSKAVVPTTHMTIMNAIGTWALTAGISFPASTIVPLGIGVREFTLTMLFPSDISVVEGMTIALLMRVLFLTSDLVWGGIIWGIARHAWHRLQRRNLTNHYYPNG